VRLGSLLPRMRVLGATGRPRPNCASRFDSIVPW
jgi:hypothetical protein